MNAGYEGGLEICFIKDFEKVDDSFLSSRFCLMAITSRGILLHKKNEKLTAKYLVEKMYGIGSREENGR